MFADDCEITGFNQALLETITQKYIISPSSTVFSSEMPSSFSTPVPSGVPGTPATPGQPGPASHPAAHGVNPLLAAATHANTSGFNAGAPLIPSYTRAGGHSQTPTSVKILKPPEYFPEWKDHGSSNGGDIGADRGESNQNSSAGGPSGPSSLTGGHHGMEEAIFLGAQVAAKVIFILDQGLSKGFMSRVEYNENGPSAIHDYIL